MTDETKNYKVGMIISLTSNGDVLSGIIETVNDKEPIIPFTITGPHEKLEKGKMVKFKKAGTIVQRAIDVMKL
jgi:uncharacterized protein YkvS